MSVAHDLSPAPGCDVDGMRPAIGLWGTFDVDNYGDHLFPLVARRELGRRVPWADVRVASPYGHLHPTRFDGVAVDPLPPWDSSVAASLVETHVAVVIGGGEILHLNDPLLAPVYGTAGEELDRLRPSSWFADVAHASTDRHPVVWNAVGISDGLDGDDQRRLARAASSAAYVAVRDEASAARLERMGVGRDIAMVPDTALLLDRVFDEAVLDARAEQVRRRAGGRATIAVQGCDLLLPHVDDIARMLRRWLSAHGDLLPLVVETGRGRGDHVFGDALARALDRRVLRLPVETDAAGVASAIRSSVAFVGSSLHGSITAKVFGVPFVTMNVAAEAKLDGCAGWFGSSGVVVHRAADVGDALDAVASVRADVDHLRSLQERVDAHFDRIADIAAGANRAQPLRPRVHDEVDRARATHPAAVRARAPMVGVVVVDHDGGDATAACIEQLHRVTWPADRLRIVVVDNGSEDATACAAIAETWPDVDVVRVADNRGYGAGANAGIARLEGHTDFVLLLNNDVVPTPAFIEPLVAAFDADPTLGAVVPKVLLDERFVRVEVSAPASRRGPADDRALGVQISDVEVDGRAVTSSCHIVGTWGPERGGGFEWTRGDAVLWAPVASKRRTAPSLVRVRVASPGRRTAVTIASGGAVVRRDVEQPEWITVTAGSAIDLVNGTGIVVDERWHARDRDFLKRDGDPPDRVDRRIDAWSGACVLLRSSYVRDVGPFRDDLFLYYEDVDLSLRGRRRGWRYEVQPASVVRHEHNAATRSIPDLVRHVSHRNRLLVTIEHAPWRAVANVMWDEIRGLARAVRYDVVARRVHHRPADLTALREQALVLGGVAQRLPRSLRGRRRRPLTPPLR